MENTINELVGTTLISISGMTKDSDEITFQSDDGRKWVMNHSQDCCESVLLDDIVGESSDLLNSPILQAEEVSNSEPQKPNEFYEGSHTWTFYRLATIKGSVVLKWYGTSNGYYSESVDFGRVV
jgi:hypothetical protein